MSRAPPIVVPVGHQWTLVPVAERVWYIVTASSGRVPGSVTLAHKTAFFTREEAQVALARLGAACVQPEFDLWRLGAAEVAIRALDSPFLSSSSI